MLPSGVVYIVAEQGKGGAWFKKDAKVRGTTGRTRGSDWNRGAAGAAFGGAKGDEEGMMACHVDECPCRHGEKRFVAYDRLTGSWEAASGGPERAE